jgi:pimeloyl-ACP methyl ester carboxylesterase
MPLISLNGETFHYDSVGEGPPFVFQHGMGADTTQPLSSGKDLSGWRVIAMDSRGHGETEADFQPALLSFAQLAEDLRELLDSLHIDRAVVGGISMGAGVALALAVAHPERVSGLALVRPAWLDRAFPANLRWFPSAAELLHGHPVAEAAELFKQRPEFLELEASSKPAAESLIRQFYRPQARERAAVLAKMPGSAPLKGLSQCSGLQLPALVVVTDRDPMHPDFLGKRLASAIPGAELRRITSKTESELLHQAELATALKQFLDSIEQNP